MTLNHYLLVFTENGVFAFLFFTGFLVLVFRRSEKKLLIGTILFSLLFNNFFWFPEGFLLFWVIVALDTGTLNESQAVTKGKKKYSKPLIAFSIVVFLAFNIVQFNTLHPNTWAQKTGEPYDYGFWYQEKDQTGRPFRWTMETAGQCFTLDQKGESPTITLECGAPLPNLPGKKQIIRIYWQGKLYKEINFIENKKETFKIKAEPNTHGFLEIEARPAFNLEKMNLGPETRDLGIKIFLN